MLSLFSEVVLMEEPSFSEVGRDSVDKQCINTVYYEPMLVKSQRVTKLLKLSENIGCEVSERETVFIS